MCPGGLVVPAASEEGGLVTNGMSEHARDQKNANSGLLVQVFPEDFPTDHPLAGVEFQKELEHKAILTGEDERDSTPVITASERAKPCIFLSNPTIASRIDCVI